MTTNPANSDDQIPHESNEEDVAGDQDAEATSTAPTDEKPTVPPGSTS